MAKRNDLHLDTTGEFMIVDPASLHPRANQPRKVFNEDKLRSMANTMLDGVGVIEPIIVKPVENDGFEIIAGERRWRAAVMAKLTRVPIIIKHIEDSQVNTLAIIENVAREDLTPIEEAEAYETLMRDNNWTAKQAADKCKVSPAKVSRMRKLLKCNEAVKKAVLDKLISWDTAADIWDATQGGNLSQEEALKKAIQHKELKKEERKTKKRQPGAPVESESEAEAEAETEDESDDNDGNSEEGLWTSQELSLLRVIAKMSLVEVMATLQKYCEQNEGKAWESRRKVFIDAEKALLKIKG